MRRVFGAAFTMAATVAVGLSWATIGNAACGKVTIAEMNWASAELMANVYKIILEKGYGCEVELVSGATMPTFTSMNEKGSPDVAPELWANAVAVPLQKAVGENRLIVGLGIENLLVVETNDAILIADKNYDQDVKKIVSKVPPELVNP